MATGRQESVIRGAPARPIYAHMPHDVIFGRERARHGWLAPAASEARTGKRSRYVTEIPPTSGRAPQCGRHRRIEFRTREPGETGREYTIGCELRVCRAADGDRVYVAGRSASRGSGFSSMGM